MKQERQKRLLFRLKCLSFYSLTCFVASKSYLAHSGHGQPCIFLESIFIDSSTFKVHMTRKLCLSYLNELLK